MAILICEWPSYSDQVAFLRNYDSWTWWRRHRWIILLVVYQKILHSSQAISIVKHIICVGNWKRKRFVPFSVILERKMKDICLPKKWKFVRYRSHSTKRFLRGLWHGAPWGRCGEGCSYGSASIAKEASWVVYIQRCLHVWDITNVGHSQIRINGRP